MILADCHTHTQFSVDSEADIVKCVEKAIELGLSAYAITDHCECNRWFSKDHYPDETTYQYFDFGRDFENSLTAVTAMKQKYSGKLNLICGVEMCQATHDLEIAEKIVSDERLDFVLGSMHQLPKTEDFCFIDYSQYSLDGIYDLAERYFLERRYYRRQLPSPRSERQGTGDKYIGHPSGLRRYLPRSEICEAVP